MGGSAVAAALVLAAAAAMVTAAKPGPKNPRYPDYIVYPRVNCTSEGVFPHPRNCSWYYRCVDPMSVGYYRTYYFECEPGTQFDDDLDQCVFSSNKRPPCSYDNGNNGNESEVIVSCRTQGCHKYAPCSNPRNLCKGCYNYEYFPGPTHNFCRRTGEVFDKGSMKCVPRPPDHERCPELISVVPALPSLIEHYPDGGPYPSTSSRPATTVTTTPSVVDVPVFSIFCTEEKRNHTEPRLLQDQCPMYCFSFNDLHGRARMCKAYYHCKRASFGGWELELRTCPENTVFIEALGECALLPKDVGFC
ncbi:uncharacterized protein LOC135113645 [Scylla paramamosain]|uniref:uncharacterized protein LOC135113645 n=1 Tax=Scylla paramamosain TaxID=85552 RepID=UPI003083B6FC